MSREKSEKVCITFRLSEEEHEKLKGKRAMSKLLITGPLAIAGLLFAFIISIFDDDVFWMALIMFSLPLLINILYIVLCFLKLKKLQQKQ